MFIALLSIALIIVGLRTQWSEKLVAGIPLLSEFPQYTRYALLIVGVVGLASRSFVFIGAEEVGHMKRIFAFQDLPKGRIIAQDGEKGPQAKILGPGFHFQPLIRVLYDIETFEPIVIPEGQTGFLIAKDGNRLPDGKYLADEWPEDESLNMLDAEYFLPSSDKDDEDASMRGRGYKGPQLSVLTPGLYRLNRYLWDVELMPAVDVPTGHVAVIRSNVQTLPDSECDYNVNDITAETNGKLAVNIVKNGCKGVWKDPLVPSRYYLNSKAYVHVIVPTRAVVWQYRGGYDAREISLKVGENGKIEQNENVTKIPVPRDAADKAVKIRAEGWTFSTEARLVAQVTPANAAKVIASVGGLKELEDKIITPIFRDLLRTEGGNRRALDFVEKRDEIVSSLEKVMKIEGDKAGVSILELRLGEPNLPPELLVTRAREQLAGQLKSTYEAERESQNERIAVEKSRAEADQQATLVAAQINKLAAAEKKEQLRLEGEGQKLKLLEIAQGQKAQANVLGEDRVLTLKLAEMILDAAIKNPELVKVPMVNVQGDGSSLEGAAAVLSSQSLLGNSTISKTLQQALAPSSK